MRLKDNLDIPGFLQAVQACEGAVYFCTPEGDRLDLKSLLSKYIFSTLTLKTEILRGGWIETTQGDALRLEAFAKK